MIRNSLGVFRVTIKKEDISSSLDILFKNFLTYNKMSYGRDGDLILTAPLSLKNDYKKILYENGIEAEFSKNKGISEFIFKYSKRWGLFLGIIILFLCVNLSSKIVWRIDIDGNFNTSDEEIVALLDDCGLRLGTYIPKINYDRLHNKFLLKSDKISWISVNVVGNVANVKVKERMKEDEIRPSTYTNVVAKEDGQIAMVTLYDGAKVINIGDIVKKGDILISGVMDSASLGVRYVHAGGIVKAYVRKNISIKIPMTQQKKMYTGNSYEDKSIKIYAKNINIFKKYRNYDMLCDKIESQENISLFGICSLPVTVYKTRYLEYRYDDVSYSQTEAKDLALIELKKNMDLALKDAELISKKVNHYCDFENYYVECELYCLEDIAELVEFEVTKE